MIETIITICSLIIICLILVRIPQKDTTSQNFEISASLLGSPKNTDVTLQNFTWFLCWVFLLLTAFTATQNT
jgi:protein translocase SecG subunit